MNKLLIATVALATFGFAATAEAKRDNNERDAFAQTVRSETLAPALVEGRNAAVAAPAQAAGVEPYIAQSVEQDARSTK